MSRLPALVFAAGWLSIVPATVEGESLRLQVCVYNQADVDEGVMASAEKIAGNIFREAGVELLWVDCGITAPGSTLLYLRLLSAPMAERLRVRPKEFGQALLARDAGYPSYAYIFYHKVTEKAGRERVLRPELLGHVMAHEMGHLLLGTNSHSRTGIMRSLWSGGTVEQVNQRWLYFTANEAERIRAQVQARIQQARELGDRPIAFPVSTTREGENSGIVLAVPSQY